MRWDVQRIWTRWDFKDRKEHPRSARLRISGRGVFSWKAAWGNPEGNGPTRALPATGDLLVFVQGRVLGDLRSLRIPRCRFGDGKLFFRSKAVVPYRAQEFPDPKGMRKLRNRARLGSSVHHLRAVDACSSPTRAWLDPNPGFKPSFAFDSPPLCATQRRRSSTSPSSVQKRYARVERFQRRIRMSLCSGILKKFCSQAGLVPTAASPTGSPSTTRSVSTPLSTRYFPSPAFSNISLRAKDPEVNPSLFRGEAS